MTDSLSSQRAEGQQPTDKRVEYAIDSLLDKLASPASVAASIAVSASSSPPSPPSYHSTFLPLSPPPSPPSPAPSLSLLGKLALSNYIPSSSHSPAPTLSPLPSVSLSPLLARPSIASFSPPPVPLLFSRPATTTPLALRSPPRSHSQRSPPRVPSFSPPLDSTAFATHHTQPPPSYRPHTHTAAPSFPAPFRAAEARELYERRREGQYELEDEWRISSEADVRRMLDELRDELQHVAHKLAAIKRYTARAQQQQQPSTSYYRHTEDESEYAMDTSPPLSPRTRHIMQLLEEADELLQHNKPVQPNHPTDELLSRAGMQTTDQLWEAEQRRPRTAPSRQFAGSTGSSRSVGSIQSAASTHLLRAYDELLDRFRSQVLRIDATLAAVD